MNWREIVQILHPDSNKKKLWNENNFVKIAFREKSKLSKQIDKSI